MNALHQIPFPVLFPDEDQSAGEAEKTPICRIRAGRLAVLLTASALGFGMVVSGGGSAAAQDLKADDVITTLKRSADWQIANRTERDLTGWIIAPFYDGLWRTAMTTGDAKYLAVVMSFGNTTRWSPGRRIYHADDHAVGHAWLDVHLMDEAQVARLQPFRNRLDQVIANPVAEDLAFGRPVTTPGVQVTDRWTWCDALYMAPPTLARLFTATGDSGYLDFLHQEFLFTYNLLYDSGEGLFFRDSTFTNATTPNGNKVFWSRGNGWVYGGLALTLEHLPKDHPTRPFYETLFREMTVAVLRAQQPDGLWRPSLADPAHVPVGETSGSGFFTFGLAWGVNNGLLEHSVHWPAVEAGWRGLLTRLGANGMVGYVQQPGAAPGLPAASSTREYGTGAFLLAGCEVLRGIGGVVAVDPAVLLAEAELILRPLPPEPEGSIVNLSTRVRIDSGEVAIGGFVAIGSSPVRVLVRAAGPGLVGLGVADALWDPRLILFEEGVEVASNDDWDAEEIGDVFDRTGAFPFGAGSKDAALIATIEPGKRYTAHVRGDVAGVILIEVYEIP